MGNYRFIKEKTEDTKHHWEGLPIKKDDIIELADSSKVEKAQIKIWVAQGYFEEVEDEDTDTEE